MFYKIETISFIIILLNQPLFSSLFNFKMSNTLYISHAHVSCNAGFVKQVFEDILGDIIDHVDEVTRKHDNSIH